jgi:hypothetical protein
MESADASLRNDKVRRCKRVLPDKVENAAIDLRAKRLHHVINQCEPAMVRVMEESKRWIKPLSNHLDPDFALECCIRVVEHDIERVNRMTICTVLQDSLTHATSMPLLRDRLPSYAFPPHPNFLRTQEVGKCCPCLDDTQRIHADRNLLKVSQRQLELL